MSFNHRKLPIIVSPLLLQSGYWDTLSFDLPNTVSFMSKFKVIHLQIMKTGYSSR